MARLQSEFATSSQQREIEVSRQLAAERKRLEQQVVEDLKQELRVVEMGMQRQKEQRKATMQAKLNEV